MTDSRPSSADYRAALTVLRRVAPDEAAVISGYVTKNLKLLAAARLEQSGTEARIRDLSRQAVASAPAESETFVVVDGETVSLTSSVELTETAIVLVDELRSIMNSPEEIAARLQAASTRYGPVAVTIFAAALQYALMTDTLAGLALSSG